MTEWHVHAENTRPELFSRALEKAFSRGLTWDKYGGMATPPAQAAGEPSKLRRWLPLAGLAAVIAVAYALGLHRYLSVAAIVENRDALHDFVDRNLALALIVYIAIYIVTVTLSLPGSAFLSIAGSFAFGWMLSVPASVIAATIGATIVFQIVKTSLGASLAERAGPLVKKLREGFARDSFNYLLFLRLTPVFPFFAVNAVAGLCGVALRTFVLATLIGIIPGSIAFAWLGSGLDSVIEKQVAIYRACKKIHGMAMCSFEISAFSLLTPQLLLGFAALGAVALIPIAIRRFRSAA
jgi:uncharacterized membrane protein YdjX (TVP38/TMEM64 family)